jgi:hypothetical protein
MVGREPTMDHLDDLNRSIIEFEAPGRLFAPVARITFNFDPHAILARMKAGKGG